MDIDIDIIENGFSTKIISPLKYYSPKQNGYYFKNPYEYKRCFRNPADEEVDELFEYNVIKIDDVYK